MVVLLQLIIAILYVLGSHCDDETLGVNDSLTLKLLRKMEILEQKNERLEKRSEILEQKNERLEKRSENLEAKVKILEQKNKRLEKRSAQINEMPVAFTVELTQSNKPIGDHQTIEYDHVVTNLGNGYEPRTGHFTCPVKGLYLFAVTVMSASHSIFTEVVKDGVRVTRMYSTVTEASSTTSVFLITLDVGQMVWVRSTYLSNQIIHGDYYDTFSGTLIFQMS